MISALCYWSQLRTKWEGATQGCDHQEVMTIGGDFSGFLPHPSKPQTSILEVLMLEDDLARWSIKVSM